MVWPSRSNFLRKALMLSMYTLTAIGGLMRTIFRVASTTKGIAAQRRGCVSTPIYESIRITIDVEYISQFPW
jgi:hypothetical protein